MKFLSENGKSALINMEDYPEHQNEPAKKPSAN